MHRALTNAIFLALGCTFSSSNWKNTNFWRYFDMLQTCLPQNTSSSTPNSPCLYCQIFDRIFCGCTTNQLQQNSVKNQFFYHTSSIIQTHYSDDFILFTLPKVVLHQRPQNTFSKSNAPCVLLSLMLTRPFLNGCCLVGVCFLGFVHSSSSLSVSCSLLSPTASNWNPPYQKMANFHTASNAKIYIHWFKNIIWPMRFGHKLQPRK